MRFAAATIAALALLCCEPGAASAAVSDDPVAPPLADGAGAALLVANTRIPARFLHSLQRRESSTTLSDSMEAVIGGTSPFSALLVPLPLLDSLTINGGTTGSNKHSGNIITDHSDGCSSVSINLGDFDPDRFLRQSNPPRWIALLAPSDQSPCSVCSVRRAMGQSGAAAVIFGSSRDRDDPIDCVDMPAPGRDEFKQQTLIPALRIAFDDYEFLLEETERLWMERKNRKKKLQLLRVRIVPDPNSAVLIFIIAWPFLVIGLYEIGYIVNARMSSYKNAIAVRNLPSKLWKQKNFERRQSDESSSVSTPCSVDENTMPIGFGDDLCAICLEDYIPGDRVRQLPCRHEFHADCVDRWLFTIVLCPMCKKSVFNTEDTSLHYDSDDLFDNVVPLLLEFDVENDVNVPE